MARVNQSTNILHSFNPDPKGLGWAALIIAAEAEIERIEQRAAQLREVVVLFRKKEQAGDPVVLDAKDSTVRRDVTALQQHAISPLPLAANRMVTPRICSTSAGWRRRKIAKYSALAQPKRRRVFLLWLSTP
jgi:hypothetical protein